MGPRPHVHRGGAVPDAERRQARDPERRADLLDVRRGGGRAVAAQRSRVDEVAVLHHHPGLFEQEVELGQGAVAARVDVDEGAAGDRGTAVEVVDAGAPAIDADEAVLPQQLDGHLPGERGGAGRRRLGGAVADDEQRRAVGRGVGEPDPHQPDPRPAQTRLGGVGLDGEQGAVDPQHTVRRGGHGGGQRAGAVAELHRGEPGFGRGQRHRSGSGHRRGGGWSGHVLPAHRDGRPLRRPDRAPGEQHGDAQQQAGDHRPPRGPRSGRSAAPVPAPVSLAALGRRCAKAL